MKTQDPDRVLYLAVPEHAYNNVFTREVGQVAIEEFKLQLIVFSTEEYLIWKKD